VVNTQNRPDEEKINMTLSPPPAPLRPPGDPFLLLILLLFLLVGVFYINNNIGQT
jgi:hypothetical protein